MSNHITRNYIKANFDKIIKVGYADLHYLLKLDDKIGYNAGYYGWNFDCYVIGDICITTGYRNLVGISVDYDIIEKYNNKAMKAFKDNAYYDQLYPEIEKIKAEFIQEINNTYFKTEV